MLIRLNTFPVRLLEHDMRRAGDERIVGEPRVLPQVGDHQKAVLENGVPAERDIPGCPLYVGAEPGLKPLPLTIHEGDERHRDTEVGGGRPRHTVEVDLRRRRQEIEVVQCSDACLVVGRDRCC